MADVTYEALKRRISEELTAPKREFGKLVGDIGRNFRSLGLETAVWLPERVHTTNLGGINADSYFGYSRVEGKWGLIIRTIERDQESRAFVGQRVYPIESCGNMEIVVNALKKVPELLLSINKAIDHQIETLENADGEFDRLRDPECRF